MHFRNKLECLSLQALQPSLIVVGKAKSLLKYNTFLVLYSRVCSANIRQGWKGFPRINTRAYFKHLVITDVKSFLTLAPDVNVIKLFIDVNYECK